MMMEEAIDGLKSANIGELFTVLIFVIWIVASILESKRKKRTRKMRERAIREKEQTQKEAASDKGPEKAEPQEEKAPPYHPVPQGPELEVRSNDVLDALKKQFPFPENEWPEAETDEKAFLMDQFKELEAENHRLQQKLEAIEKEKSNRWSHRRSREKTKEKISNLEIVERLQQFGADELKNGVVMMEILEKPVSQRKKKQGGPGRSL